MPIYPINKHREHYEQYFMLMFPKVKAFIQKILKSEEDAEDIAQDVFVKLWNTPDLLEDILERGDSYVYVMARNHVFNFIKHKDIEQTYIENEQKKENAEDFPLESEIYGHIYEQELKLLIKMALEQMPDQRRRVFLLNRRDGKSNAEIAELLQLSIRTVERHLYLALVDLKKIILIAFFLLLR